MTAAPEQTNAAEDAGPASIAWVRRLILVCSLEPARNALNLTYLLQIQQNEGDFPHDSGRIWAHPLNWLLR